ncbi:MAG TPA: hypothetical protein VF190_12740, partial [Rhodothermales bacterium]
PSLLRPLLLALALALAGCADEVTDAEKTTRAFTLYGYLDPKSDVQVVRVFPIQPLLERIGPEIDAEVRYLDLETGAAHPGVDSVVSFPSGEYGHVFNGHFRARYGSTYRVEVTRSDGAESFAEVTVPSEVTVEELPVFITRSVDSPTPRPHLPLFFKGEPTWIATATAIYDVEIYELFARRQVRISYDYRPEQVEGGWQVAVDLTTDFEHILSTFIGEFGPAVEDYQILFIGLRFVVDVVNEGWYPPTGRFDAELLVEPGLMTNVDNGFGFIGSGYRLTHEMKVPECLLSWAGYAFMFGPCTSADWCQYTGARCDD